MTQLYLVRHGETQWNALRKLQGQLDSCLTDKGIQQAHHVAKQLERDSIEKIFSSSLGRAVDTACICAEALGLPLIFDDELVERHFGDWQSLFFEDLRSHQLFKDVFTKVTEKAPPNGESGVDCGKRIKAVLTRISKNNKNKTLLIVTHGDAIRCFNQFLYGKVELGHYNDYENGRIFKVKYCHSSEQFLV